MSKFGGFFSRKTGLYDKSADFAAPVNATSNDNPLELDEELVPPLRRPLRAHLCRRGEVHYARLRRLGGSRPG